MHQKAETSAPLKLLYVSSPSFEFSLSLLADLVVLMCRMGYFKGDDNLGTVAGAMQLSQSLISHIKISCMYSILINVHEWCMHISCVDYSS